MSLPRYRYHASMLPLDRHKQPFENEKKIKGGRFEERKREKEKEKVIITSSWSKTVISDSGFVGKNPTDPVKIKIKIKINE